MSERIVSAEEARGLLERARGPLVAELDVFDPDEREAEASVHTPGVTVLFTAGTGEAFPNGTNSGADLDRWRALNDSEPMRYARLFAAAPNLAHTVVVLSWELDRLRAAGMSNAADVAKMQRVVYDALISGVKFSIPGADLGRIDGAASDGDEFDFTAAEVSIALSMFDDALAEVREECDDARRERDRLRDILAAERGERAPEGWVWQPCGGWGWAWVRGAESPNDWIAVQHKPDSGWFIRLGATFIDLHKQLGITLPTALEAIECADRAAKEGK